MTREELAKALRAAWCRAQYYEVIDQPPSDAWLAAADVAIAALDDEYTKAAVAYAEAVWRCQGHGDDAMLAASFRFADARKAREGKP